MKRQLLVWRSVALLAIMLAAAFACYQLTLPLLPDYGIGTAIETKSPGTVVVTSVDAHSAAARAGIKVGDRVAYGNTQMERARVLYAFPGTRVRVIVNGSRTATLVAPRAEYSATLAIPLVVRLAFLLVAALLAWRRFDDAASRSLVGFLSCYGLAIGMRNTVFPSPALTLVIVQIGSSVALLMGTACAAVFAATFPSGTAQSVPRALSRVAIVIAVAGCAASIGSLWLARSAAQSSIINFLILGAMAVVAVLVVVTLASAYVQGAREERQRRRWIFLLLGIGLAAVALELSVLLTAGYSFAVDIITLLIVGAVPFGLAYVILRHRVLDVGFVLNRAVVYTGVSIVIVGVFVVVETLLGKYVENSSHVTSVAVQLAVALALGFSIRYVHARVDAFVDRVLFRERHLAEAAIRDFAYEAAYITDADVLVTRTVNVVERHAAARGAGVWLADGRLYRAAAHTFAAAPDVDENDPAVVSMRARRVSVHIRDCGSALPGMLALPMIVRGELLGILVCGPKTDDEVYDPDEESGLAALASSVGHALDAIEVRDLRRRLQAVTATGGGRP